MPQEVYRQRCRLELHLWYHLLILQYLHLVRTRKRHGDIILFRFVSEWCCKTIRVAINGLFYIKRLNKIAWLEIPQLQYVLIPVIPCKYRTVSIVQRICRYCRSIYLSYWFFLHSNIPNLESWIPSATEKDILVLRKTFDAENPVVMVIGCQLVCPAMNINLN